MNSWTIIGYTYNAGVYCATCILNELSNRGDLLDAQPVGFDAEVYLHRAAESIGIDRMDESSFDSGDFPKVIFADQDDDDYCGRCGDKLIDD